MGKCIISGDFVDLGTITSRSEDANYPDGNVEDLWHLKRQYRANDTTTNDWLLKFDFGAAKSVVGLFLNDVNFNEVTIQGNAADAWGAPAYSSGATAISLDERVSRYKIYLPITGFNLQWMRIFIPATAASVGSYKDKWMVGTVVPLDSVTTLTRNINFPYQRGAEKSYEDIALPHGGFERVGLGNDLKWVGEMTFGRRDEPDEAELWTVNRYNIENPLIIYENLGDNSKAYLCLRDDDYRGELVASGVVVGNTIKFKELI